MEERDPSKVTVGGSNPSRGAGFAKHQMNTLSLTMKVASLTSTNPLAADALLKLGETETGFEILKVLDWVEKQMNEDS